MLQSSVLFVNFPLYYNQVTKGFISTPVVLCEFDKFGVDTHLRKLRDTPAALFYASFFL